MSIQETNRLQNGGTGYRFGVKSSFASLAEHNTSIGKGVFFASFNYLDFVRFLDHVGQFTPQVPHAAVSYKLSWPTSEQLRMLKTPQEMVATMSVEDAEIFRNLLNQKFFAVDLVQQIEKEENEKTTKTETKKKPAPVSPEKRKEAPKTTPPTTKKPRKSAMDELMKGSMRETINARRPLTGDGRRNKKGTRDEILKAMKFLEENGVEMFKKHERDLDDVSLNLEKDEHDLDKEEEGDGEEEGNTKESTEE